MDGFMIRYRALVLGVRRWALGVAVLLAATASQAIQITLEDLTHVDFVDLALIEENNPVDLTAFRHDRGYNQELKGRAV